MCLLARLVQVTNIAPVTICNHPYERELPMTAETSATTPKKWQIWTGRVLSGLPVLTLLFSVSMKLGHKPEAVGMFVNHLGYEEGMLTKLAILEILCTVIYLVPRTSVFGAILLTGYLGGAVATHARVGDPFLAPVVLGIMLWGGLFLREPRLRGLLPFRSP